MAQRNEKIEDVVQTFVDALRSDRDVNIAFGGMTGVGKTTCLWSLHKEFCKLMKKDITMDTMTWERAELLKWVDGDKEGAGRLPEYSSIMADELISMFYKRNWYEDGQKAAIELFNKCRDRHLLLMGAVPNFWDLDSGMISRFRFYIYIPFRGVAWVFKQENNPFASDQWNIGENRKAFRKKKNPFSCPNFAFQFNFDDFAPEEKTTYLQLRNTKRRDTENQNKGKDKPVRYRAIKIQRDEAIKLAYETGKYTLAQISERVNLDASHIGDVCNGVA